ncbi:hypothetical protein QC764_300235 [Podospora pseudoanserina]|uniref:SMP-30/Gluconolactonase/LRE-like region domain-containing protein n=1 Tax=Podospora pseudoanserina TaxID=2609844 RepID=A0ABR0IBS3_9PEZI|nr:hypothetical protein QC764_300235 [Podospora pseudoanserina]
MKPSRFPFALLPLAAAARGGSFRGLSHIATEIFSFPPTNPIFIENLFVLPDARLLLTSFVHFGPDTNSPLHILNPVTSSVSVVTTLPNSTSQTGIAKLSGTNRYAVTAGILGDNFEFLNNTVNVYVVSLGWDASSATVVDTIPVPGVISANGLVAVGNVVLSADSRGGRILRVDTVTRTSSVAFADPLLFGDPANVSGSLGITGVNGLFLKRHGGQRWVYFTNSARGVYGRFKVNSLGYKVGRMEVLMTATSDDPVGFTNSLDDLVVDGDTDGYIAWQDRSLLKVKRYNNGTTAQTVVLGPGGVATGNTGITLKTPTSVALGLDGGHIYVGTGGAVAGNLTGGQVVKVTI